MFPSFIICGGHPVEDQAALRPLPAPAASLRRDGADGLATLWLCPRRVRADTRNGGGNGTNDGEGLDVVGHGDPFAVLVFTQAPLGAGHDQT